MDLQRPLQYTNYLDEIQSHSGYLRARASEETGHVCCGVLQNHCELSMGDFQREKMDAFFCVKIIASEITDFWKFLKEAHLSSGIIT